MDQLFGDGVSVVRMDGGCYLLNLDGECGDFLWMLHDETHVWLDFTISGNEHSLSIYPFRNLDETPAMEQIMPTVNAIMKVLSRATKLETLEIEGCDRTCSLLPVNADILSTVVGTPMIPRTIKFTKFKFGTDQIRDIVSNMTSNDTLVASRCDMEDGGAAMVETLEKNTIGFSRFEIKNEGFPVVGRELLSCFCASLRNNTSLKVLRIENGALAELQSDGTWDLFMAALRSNRGLVELSVEGNSIPGAQLASFLHALLYHPTMTVINLENISDDLELDPQERSFRNLAIKDFHEYRRRTLLDNPMELPLGPAVPNVPVVLPPRYSVVPHVPGANGPPAMLPLHANGAADSENEEAVPTLTEERDPPVDGDDNEFNAGPASRTRSKRRAEEEPSADSGVPRRSKRRRVV